MLAIQFRPPIKRTGNLRGSHLLGRRGVWGNLLCVSAAKNMRRGGDQQGASPPMTARVRPHRRETRSNRRETHQRDPSPKGDASAAPALHLPRGMWTRPDVCIG